MKKVGVELSAKQAEQLLNQLPVSVKIYLVRRWAKETWPDRFRRLLQGIDDRLDQNPSLKRQALKAIGPARRAFYASRCRH